MSEPKFINTNSQFWQNLEQFPGTQILSLAEPVPQGSIHRLRMNRGTVIPVHHHPCDEYVYVLEGIIETDGRECQAGTFWFTPATTKNGSHKAITDFELDLSNLEAAAKLIEIAQTKFGNLSILVNNATYSVEDGFEKLNAQILDATYSVNLRATALLSVEFSRRYSGEAGGRIINLTSGQFQGAMPKEIAYAATKGAVDALTITLAAEVADKGITVNAVNPGATDTGWMSEGLKQEVLPRFPKGRIGQPEDAARLIVFLASDDAQWITGQIIHSEGGFMRI